MRILILGSNGFLARNIITHLVSKREIKLTKHANSISDKSNKIESTIEADLSDYDSISDAFRDKRFDVVINCVWFNSHGEFKNDYSMQAKNVLISLNISKLSKLVNSKALISFGSIHEFSVYQNLDSLSNYGLFKFSTHIIMKNLLKLDGINFIYYIIPNLFGKEDSTNNLMNRILKSIYSQRELLLQDNGDLMEFLDANSLSKYLVEHLLAFNNSGTYLVTSGNLNTISFFVDKIESIIDLESPIKVIKNTNLQNDHSNFLKVLDVKILKFPFETFESEFRKLYLFKQK